MNLTQDLIYGASNAGRPAALFTVNKNYHIDNVIQCGQFFKDSYLNTGFQNAQDFLSFDNPDVGAAIEKAFKRQPSQARFRRKIGEKEYHFDLYCFPELGQDNPSIWCFVVDRCLDVETALALQVKVDRLDIINQAVRAFAETTNLTEILRIILLAVTSGPGLGFNRGFILLSDESRTFLHGCMATGPSSPMEAGEIWRRLSEQSLSLAEVLGLYRKTENLTDIYVNQLVTSLKIPVAGISNFLTRSFEERRGLCIGPETPLNEDEKKLKEKLGAESLAVAPLISRESWLGVILADNLITRKPISVADLKLLEIFARYASDAIDNTHLHGRLQRKIARLKEANEKIIRTRENLVRAEKWSSVSKMALEVAHEIRNPLTVIGGHANARLRKLADDSEDKKIFGIISRQAGRIENTLNRFSSIVSLGEKHDDKFKISELVLETLRTMTSVETDNMPEVIIDRNIENEKIFIDQGLFYKAMIEIFKEASSVAGGLSRLRLVIKRQYDSATILIGCDEKCDKMAETFFGSMRTGQGELKSQEMTIAFEILQHYGGDLGIGSPGEFKGWLAVEFPLIKEEK